MNGFAFCETDSKRQARHHRYRLHDLTKCLIVSNGASKCEPNSSTTPPCPDLSRCENLQSPKFAWWIINEVQQLMTTKQTLLITALCCLCYFNALRCDFAFDDISAIKENRDLRPETSLSQLLWNDFWGQPMAKEHSHKSYRPVCVLSFRLNFLLHQLHPFGYHLINVLLHIAVSVLYLRYCRLIVPSQCAFLAAVLFSVHPIHTEAVTSVVGRAECLSAFFYLISLILYSRATERRNATKWPLILASIGCICLATFSKEQGVTAFALCVVYEALYNQKLYQFGLALPRAYIGHKGPKWIKEMTRRVGLLGLAAVAVIALRLRVMQSQLPVFTRFDNPAAYASSPVRQMTHNYLFALNAWLLLNPMHLCCDWTMGTIPLLESLADARNAATIGLYLTLFALAYKAASSRDATDCRAIIFGLSLLILPFLPASNLFFYVGFVIAERILYIPSFGFCLLVAYGMNKLFMNQTDYARVVRPILVVALLLVVASHSGRTILRNEDWKTELALFSSGIRANPRNAKLFNNVGHVLESENRHSEALQYFLRASQVQPDDLGAYLNVGRAYVNLKKFDLAEHYFWKAKNLLPAPEVGQKGSFYARVAPSHLNVFINLGNLISQNKSRLAEAEQLYRQAIRMRPDFVEAHINRAEILLKMNRSAEAEEVYKAALHLNPDNPDLFYNLGVVAIESGKLQQAVTYFDAAIRLNPQHSQALLNFAIVVQDAGRNELLDLAEHRLKQLLAHDQANERAYFHLGMIAMNAQRHQQAEQWFSSAVHLRDDFQSASFNLALLLSNTGRPLEALPHLNRLVSHHPGHMKGLTLLCDILINHAKNMSQAEVCYGRILAISPGNIQAKHNLCVVYVEQGRLEKAEHCLLEAAQMAPHKDYLERHLKIVRLRIAKLRQAQKSAP